MLRYRDVSYTAFVTELKLLSDRLDGDGEHVTVQLIQEVSE